MRNGVLFEVKLWWLVVWHGGLDQVYLVDLQPTSHIRPKPQRHRDASLDGSIRRSRIPTLGGVSEVREVRTVVEVQVGAPRCRMQYVLVQLSCVRVGVRICDCACLRVMVQC